MKSKAQWKGISPPSEKKGDPDPYSTARPRCPDSATGAGIFYPNSLFRAPSKMESKLPGAHVQAQNARAPATTISTRKLALVRAAAKLEATGARVLRGSHYSTRIAPLRRLSTTSKDCDFVSSDFARIADGARAATCILVRSTNACISLA
jgi:hypothetical protein